MSKIKAACTAAQQANGYSADRLAHIVDIFKTIKEQVSILEALEYFGYHPIRRGTHYWLECLFHLEAEPSLCVYPETNSFYCFGCGAAGDVITFAAKYFDLPPLQAAQKLADAFGITISTRHKSNLSLVKKDDEALQDIAAAKGLEALLQRAYDEYSVLYRFIRRAKQKLSWESEAYALACELEPLYEAWLDILQFGETGEQVRLLQELGYLPKGGEAS